MKTQKFDLLTVPCDIPFVVTKNQEEFLNFKTNKKEKQQREEILKKIKINNLIESGPVLKKTIQFKK